MFYLIKKFFKVLFINPNRILRIFFLDKNLNKFRKHNLLIWKNYKVKKPKGLFLVDNFNIPEWVIANSYFSNIFAKQYKAEIKFFSYRPLIDFSNFHNSYNVKDNIFVSLNYNQKKELNKIIKKFKNEINTKTKLFNFSINKIWIGVDIYETYLRSGRATINFNDKVFWKVVFRGIKTYIFWRDFFKHNKILGINISHDCYVDMNIIAKIAYHNKVPVYLINPRGLHKSVKPYSIYNERFLSYPKKFKALNKNQKKEALVWSKSRFKKKFLGEAGVDASYSTKSSFSKSIKKKILLKSDKLKIVIATHCFYDNPHGYGKILFNDFFEWLSYLCKISEKTNYDWYIKPHPDYLPGTIENILSIINKYKKVKLISEKTSFHQLKKEGLSWVITCFGSVAHELPLLGINVVNCGMNPHIGYDFNFNPKSKKELTDIILNLKNLKKKIDKKKIYEFYFMYKLGYFLDRFIFDSYYEMQIFFKNKKKHTSEVYKYFLDGFNISKHKIILNKIESFLRNKDNHYFKFYIPKKKNIFKS